MLVNSALLRRGIIRCGALALTAAVASACGSDAPPYYYYPVGPCTADVACPFGSYCIEPAPGACLAPCRTDYDCPLPYACRSRDRRGVKGKLSVCAPP
jgi:hypothetical protein